MFFLKENLYLDPLEQFELNNLFNISGESFFHINTSTVFFIITLVLLHFFFSNINYSQNVNSWYFIFFEMHNMLRNLLLERISTKKNTLYFNITFLFFLILIFNLLGLIPNSWTISSWFIIIFFIALAYFININIMLLLNNGWRIFAHFLPSGTPLIISPFLFLVENISYFSRVISLSVRLFANMLSGHALLKILISFSWSLLLKLQLSLYFLAVLIWVAITIILILECLIACLQAYVFGLLVVIYFSEAFE